MSIEIDKSRYKSIASPENFVIIDFYRQTNQSKIIDNYRALSTYRLAFRWSISIDMLRPDNISNPKQRRLSSMPKKPQQLICEAILVFLIIFAW